MIKRGLKLGDIIEREEDNNLYAGRRRLILSVKDNIVKSYVITRVPRNRIQTHSQEFLKKRYKLLSSKWIFLLSIEESGTSKLTTQKT